MAQNKNIDNSFMASKFGRLLFTILAVFLTFAGPTYVVYGLAILLKVDFFASLGVGLALFIIGLVMMRFLVQKKIIT